MSFRVSIFLPLFLFYHLSSTTRQSLGQEFIGDSAARIPEAEIRIDLVERIDDALIQAELSRIGGQMVETGQTLAKNALLKTFVSGPLTLASPSTAEIKGAALAARCKAAVLVVAKLVRTADSNGWMALLVNDN